MSVLYVNQRNKYLKGPDARCAFSTIWAGVVPCSELSLQYFFSSLYSVHLVLPDEMLGYGKSVDISASSHVSTGHEDKTINST